MVLGVWGHGERLWRQFFGRSCSSGAATLLPIISNHVEPGSIIYSDEWGAYNQLSATTRHIHRTMNHSLYYVHPATGAHTQGVEGMWSACNRMMREEKTMHSKLFDTYLPEFMCRRKFGGLVALAISLSIFQNSTQCNVLKVYLMEFFDSVHNLDLVGKRIYIGYNSWVSHIRIAYVQN